MTKQIFLAPILLIMLVFTSCTTKKHAELIVKNAKVYTVDNNFGTAESFAVIDGKFAAVGSEKYILENYSSDNVLDAGGRPIYPGFNDGHCHFYGYAIDLQRYADLTGTTSFDEVLQRLKDYQDKYNYDWVLGRGWDQNDWENKQFPDNDKLNELFPDKPVMLIRVDGHAVLANTLALEKAGITSSTKIDGGEVQLKNGKPTGILLDNAVDLLQKVIPQAGEALIKDALMKAQANCFKAGLTSVTDAGLPPYIIGLYDKFQKEDSLKIRINAMLDPEKPGADKILEKGPQQNGMLSVISIKLYADGALGSRGALLLKPYSDDPGNSGLQIHPTAFFREMLSKAYKYNFQVNTHCIGDSANRMMLRLYAEQLKDTNDRRWRIEHAQVIAPEDFAFFGKYNIIPSIQSTHATSDMYWAEKRLGPERIKGAYAYKKLLDENGWLVNGTDFPVEDISPLLTFYAAVSRQDVKDYPSGGFQPENALSREEALKSITIWPAKGSFEEKVKGSIEPGKYADFVILENDLMTVDIHEVPLTRVLKTFIAGQEVYEH